MKLCILSDSHGNGDLVEKVLVQERPDMALFLGDGIRDIIFAAEKLGTPYFALTGNCDLSASAPHERLLVLENKRIFMTHGHLYHVKEGMSRLRERAEENQADIALYGHTHTTYAELYDGRLYLCPGSVGKRGNSYVILTLEDGNVRYEFRTLW